MATSPDPREGSLRRLAKVLNNIHDAASSLQNHQLCCDSFTVLVRPFQANYAKLVQVPFSWIAKLQAALPDDFSWPSYGPSDGSLLERSGTGEEGGFARATKEAGRIAREFLSGLNILPATMTLPLWVTLLTGSYFSDACLATQVLATGLLSYTQAHISPLEPFFLDRDIETISLFGSISLEEFVQPQIVLRPFRTTCMNRMLKGEVLVFQHHLELGNERSLDLSASPQELLDTWVPGCYIKKRGIFAGDPDICGVRIGGGTIMKSPGQTGLYHFFPTSVSLPNDIHNLPIYRDQRITVGPPISVNEHCGNDEGMRYGQCDRYLVNLKTHPCIWEQSQRQFAFQGGQYVVVQFALTWNKTPSATIKCQLSQQSPLTTSFLENFWGLQVSFCTGIARRVRMRELLADVMTVHVRNQLVVPPVWKELEHEDMVEVLRNEPNLQYWLGKRSEEQQMYLDKIMRQILERLGPTGVDCTGSLTVAWYRPDKEPRCWRIPCEKESVWAKILVDSVDCATYAYFSSECLETKRIKCQGKHSILQRQSSIILSTAVSPHQDFAGTTIVQANFQLKDRQFYRIGDSNLVRAQALGPDETRLLFYRTSIGKPILRRIMHKERHSRIRERQDEDSPARPVLVLTAD